jgi:hypothetical protein
LTPKFFGFFVEGNELAFEKDLGMDVMLPPVGREKGHQGFFRTDGESFLARPFGDGYHILI